ncbi:hypothetical protein NIES37_26070 [Tolypothrix tenuis PCC 7101]|uniref:Uncharacterized protein n=1 Tax=Tolypothrix tenuis PCC 7101 TaxID=231146 RepID=A0A1Z4MYT5_9CYAN|nr:hypothetical protein NIES37_26070 [Tolypothrix tenuis PCC 7101]BAZ77427.1 hypothetical protein NIES50_60560 [Aulosira laxa NIES-50]
MSLCILIFSEIQISFFIITSTLIKALYQNIHIQKIRYDYIYIFRDKLYIYLYIDALNKR